MCYICDLFISTLTEVNEKGQETVFANPILPNFYVSSPLILQQRVPWK